MHETIIEAAERLLGTLPDSMDRVFFVNSGSEADDVAWRLAKAYTRRRGGVISAGSFFGITDATHALSPNSWPSSREQLDSVRTIDSPDGYRGRFHRDVEGWDTSYANLAAQAIAQLEDAGHGFAAMMMDALFTNDGILLPPTSYLVEVCRHVQRRGLLIADEIQGGFGRSGEHLWSFAAHNLQPDIVTFGKPMGNGFPVGAVATRAEILDPLMANEHLFSTFGGNPAAMAAALSVLTVVEAEGLVDQSQTVGQYLKEGLTAVTAGYDVVGDVRCMGLMAGIEVVSDPSARTPCSQIAKWIKNSLLEQGVLVGTTGPAGNVIKIRPPLTFKMAHADILLKSLEQILNRGVRERVLR